MNQRNTTSVKQNQTSRIKPSPGNVDKCMYIYTVFRYTRAFTLQKKNPQKQLWGSKCKLVRAFQALFSNTQLDVAIPLMKGWTFCEPLLQHMLGSLTHVVPGT